MKSIFLLLVLFHTTGLSAQHTVYLTIDYVKTTSISPEVRKAMPQITELQPVLYRYDYAAGKSAFRFIKGIGEREFRAFAKFDIFKDLDHRALYFRAVQDSAYVIKDDLKCREWELHRGEVKEVAGFTCYKASSEGFVVWYCEDIPVPDGPLEQTCGLPGMILSVYAAGTTIEAIQVTISDQGTPVELPVVENYHSKAELLKSRKN